MKEPGFQLRIKDPPRPLIYFNAELYMDGALLDKETLSTNDSDAAIEALVDHWARVHSLTGADRTRIVEQLKRERDLRHPPPRML